MLYIKLLVSIYLLVILSVNILKYFLWRCRRFILTNALRLLMVITIMNNQRLYFYRQQLCSLMQRIHFYGYITIGAAIGGLLYMLRNHGKSEAKDCLPLDLTRQIAQQIKYQMLMICSTFANQYDKKLKTTLAPHQLEIIRAKLRESMILLYEEREGTVLGKYQVQKQAYAEALFAYKNDTFLSQTNLQIKNMMELAVQGEHPDFTVPKQALCFLSYDQCVDTYKQLSLMVVIKVWEKIMEFTKINPNFNPKDRDDFASMIRSLSIYQEKAKFMLNRGYKEQWGCPNEIFLKILERYKLQNSSFNLKIKAIEKSYEQTLSKIADFFTELDPKKITLYYEAEILRFKVISTIQ